VAWGSDFAAWRARVRAGEVFGGEDRGHAFVLLQSRAGVPVSRLAEVLAPVFERSKGGEATAG
jgi:hypothetical protein